jgi:hypothetical protein
MMGLVEPTPVEIVSNALGHEEAEVELRGFVERAAQTVVVRGRLIRDGAHDRH